MPLKILYWTTFSILEKFFSKIINYYVPFGHILTKSKTKKVTSTTISFAGMKTKMEQVQLLLQSQF